MKNQKKYIFNVNGMHCNACVLLIDNELHDYPKVFSAKSSLQNNSVEICGDFEDISPEIIAKELTNVLIKHGYSLSVEKKTRVKNLSEFKIALPIAITFGILFFLLQKIGIINIVNTNNVSYGTAFIIGVIASLSTCMAVVGGLVLSMSATFAKEGDKIKPQFLFHGGRLLSFFILGGVIGAIGSAFTLNTFTTFLMNLIIGIVMFVLGINLLDVFDWTRKIQPSMPKFIAKHAYGISKFNHTLTPFLIGIATFFLPCGFTQSMQLYTLTTGNFFAGGFTMLAFALGTLPILVLVSFSSFSIKNSSKSGIFFKTAGLVVIMFALLNIINSFVVVGLVPPVFNF